MNMATSSERRAVVLLSGGLDSSTALAATRAEGYHCYSMAVDYGQRHQAELEAAQRIARQLGAVEHRVMKIDLAGIGGSALTDRSIAVPEQPSLGIPVTYVPARNTIFLALALAWAEVLDADAIVIGVNAVDYSGYPDCRPAFIAAFADMANLATRRAVLGQRIELKTPLIDLTKAQIVQWGAALGIDYATLSAVKDVPVVSLTNFGHEGPYRDYTLSDTVLYAMGAEMYSHGLEDREPLKLGGTAALLQCGAMAAVAAMGAITAYEIHGIGQLVDVPLFNAQVNNTDRRNSAIMAWRFSGRIQRRAAGAGAGLAGGIYPVSDGFVEVTASAGNYWRRFVEMVNDDALRDPKWENRMTAMNPAAKEEADAIVYPWMLAHTRGEAWEAAREARAMLAPLYTGLDIWQDENFRSRGFWTKIEHPELGTLPMLGRPFILPDSPWRVDRPAPSPGQHTDQVLADAGFTTGEVSSLRAQGVVA